MSSDDRHGLILKLQLKLETGMTAGNHDGGQAEEMEKLARAFIWNTPSTVMVRIVSTIVSSC